MMINNKKNILSNNQNYFTNNTNTHFVIYSSNTLNKSKTLYTSTKFRPGNALNLLPKIENLKLKASEVQIPSLGTSLYANYIKSQKLNNLKVKNNVWQGVVKPSNYYESILKISDLLSGMELNASNTLGTVNKLKTVNPSITDGDLPNLKGVELQYKQVLSLKGENSGLFMSLNLIKDYFTYLSKIVTTFNEAGGKGRLTNSNYQRSDISLTVKNKVNKNKIRHYLNLLTKFDFNLSTSYYDFFQFKKSNRLLFAMEKAAEFLKLSFLSKGCLISKPIFSIVYTHNSDLTDETKSKLSESKAKVAKANSIKAKIIIHLFYYVKKSPYEIELLNKVTSSNTQSLNLKNEGIGINSSKAYTDIGFVNSNVSDSPIIGGQVKDKFITTIFNDKFLYISDYLAKLFNADVEFELIRLYQPYQDSNILVQYLNNQSYNSKFIRLTSRLFKRINIYKKNFFNLPSAQEISAGNYLNTTLLNEKVSFPSGISGVNIKLAGRPINERIVPRFTVKRAQRGNFNRFNTKMIEKSMFTDKSRKGAFNFSVRLSHIFR